MIEVAERNGTLKQGDTILRADQRQHRHRLSHGGKHQGYRLILGMPDNMSTERQQLLKALGAEIVLTGKKALPVR